MLARRCRRREAGPRSPAPPSFPAPTTPSLTVAQLLHDPCEFAEVQMKIDRFKLPVSAPGSEASPDLQAAWSDQISTLIDRVVDGVPDGQLYNAAGSAGRPSDDETTRLILWPALPRPAVLQRGVVAAVEALDDLRDVRLLGFTKKGTEVVVSYRDHLEYCEWFVTRDGPYERSGAIRSVTFTTESEEYWSFLAARDPSLLLERYQELVSPSVVLDDLLFPQTVHRADGGPPAKRGSYNPHNSWNTKLGIVHMTAPVNVIQAAIKQCALSTIGRRVNGIEIEDPIRMTAAMPPDKGGAGVNGASDLSIAGVVSSLARARARIAMQDPVTVVLAQLDTRGWTLPEKAVQQGRRPLDYWKIIREGAGGAVRAEYRVPASEGFSVSDIRIHGVPIAHGAQIAQCLTIGLGVSAMEFGKAAHATKDREGRALRLVSGSDYLYSAAVDQIADPRFV